MCTLNKINDAEIATFLPPRNEVIMKKPCFFETVSEIEKPTVLIPNFITKEGYVEKTFTFLVKASRLKRDSDGSWRCSWRNSYVTRILFRFCKMDNSQLQEDCFPTGLIVEINKQQIPLPPCAAPLDVTMYTFKSSRISNHVTIAWKRQGSSKTKFGMSICVARRIPSEKLVQIITRKPPLKLEVTKEMIMRHSVGETDCHVTDKLRASLNCPLSLALMKIPVRSANCKHFQCFDAIAYLDINSLRMTWRCPVCEESAPLESLLVDEYFQKVLSSPLRKEAGEIEFHEDGSWTPLITDDTEKLGSTIITDDTEKLGNAGSSTE